MQITIKAFGKIAEIIQKEEYQITADNTTELKTQLEKEFPQLREMKYMIAVDKKVTHETISFNQNTEIAILPPFSGG